MIKSGSTSTSDRESVAELKSQVAALQEQLSQAQKLTSLGELMSTTTHEFNNALMTIINYAKMGLRHSDDATREKSFTKILAAGERAAKITNTVLAMARNRSESFEPTKLASIIDETLFLLERELRKYRIQIDLDLEEAPPVNAVGNQIQQVLVNLLINARQAIGEGGRVLIKLEYEKANDMVSLLIRDSGSGIPADKLPRIFDSFYSTKTGPDETGKGGSGLGLAACRNIIENHHGRIRVESSVGVGTAITIKLPIYQKPSNVLPMRPDMGSVAAAS